MAEQIIERTRIFYKPDETKTVELETVETTKDRGENTEENE